MYRRRGGGSVVVVLANAPMAWCSREAAAGWRKECVHRFETENNSNLRPNQMSETLRLFVDAALAIAIMGTFSIIAGFAAAALSGDRTAVLITMAVVFVSTGVVLLLRMWLLTPKPMTSTKSDM